MPTTFTSEDITLLGYRKAEQRAKTHDYDVFDAFSKAGVEDITTRFIYLKTRCTLEAAGQASREWSSNKSTCVVKANSRALKDDNLRRIFGNSVRLCVQDELVWEILEDSFADYLKHLEDDVPVEEHFISPRSRDRNIGDDLLPRLLNYLKGRADKNDNGKLIVLSANAGVGKTTLARRLIHNLVKQISSARTIPIYVEAQHWQKLKISSVHSLWDVIDNSLRMFSNTHLQLNEELFLHALRQGYFSFIFDGFDELCSQGTAQFDPSSVLEELCEVVKSDESEARILLTTRTLFWDAQINTVPDNVKVWFLEAFNVQQAKHYFRRVFGQSTPQCKAAQGLYDELRKQAIPRERTGFVRDQFVNLPLCVRMVVDYVSGGGNLLHTQSTEPVLMNFLLAICEREIHRQGMVTQAYSQMKSFRDMAIGDGMNPVFSIDDLGTTPDGFEEDDLSRAADHALLEKDPTGQFRFRYDFVVPFLRAAEISQWILGANNDFNSLPGSMISTLVREADGKEQVLEQLPNFLESADIDSVMEKGRIAANTNLSITLGKQAKYLSSFFFHVAQSLVSVSGESGIRKTDRTRILFSKILEIKDGGQRMSGALKGWGFLGVINGLDLRGIQFSECKFNHINFKNCLADKSTTFSKCTFEGSLYFNGGTDGWRRVTVDNNCNIRLPAASSWETLLDRSFSDDKERALLMLRHGLAKFWHHGTIKASLRMSNWTTGPLGQTGRAAELLDAMLKEELIRKIHISGVQEGGLSFDRESISDLQNFMDNSQLSGKIESVYRSLISA